MSFDLKRTHASLRLGRLIASTSALIDQEGLLLTSAFEDGVEKACLTAAPVGTEKVIGFTSLADAQPDRTSYVESILIPAIPAGFVEIDLRNTHLVTNNIRVYDETAAVVLTPDYVYAGAPAPGSVKINVIQGKMKFDFGQANHRITITYIYELTMVQSRQIFGERFINNRNLHMDFGQLEIATGLCELWTDAFDASQDYSGNPLLYLGPNGTITTVAGGPLLAATVIATPSVDANGRLAVRIRFDP